MLRQKQYLPRPERGGGQVLFCRGPWPGPEGAALVRRSVSIEASMKEKSERQGFPLWILAVVIPSVGGLLLMCCACFGFLLLTSGNSSAPKLPPGDMSLKEFLIQKPIGPTAVQVNCELATYYNFAFQRCAETHYSFRIDSHTPAFANAYVYAPKDSAQGSRLFELLKDGRKRPMTLRIQRIGPNGLGLPAFHDQCFALIEIVDPNAK